MENNRPADGLAVPRALVHAQRPVRGVAVVVLDTYREDRGLRLEPLYSRALAAAEIHEIILTDEAGASPGATVDRIAYLGFAETVRGGVVYVGDRLLWSRAGQDGPGEEHLLGHLAGFDLTHFPNHINLVVVAASLRSGADLGLQLEDILEFARP